MCKIYQHRYKLALDAQSWKKQTKENVDNVGFESLLARIKAGAFDSSQNINDSLIALVVTSFIFI